MSFSYNDMGGLNNEENAFDLFQSGQQLMSIYPFNFMKLELVEPTEEQCNSRGSTSEWSTDDELQNLLLDKLVSLTFLFAFT